MGDLKIKGLSKSFLGKLKCMKRVTGSSYEMRSRKNKDGEKHQEPAFKDSGQFVEQEDVSAIGVKVEGGRTLSMAPREFARIAFGFKGVISDVSFRDDAYMQAKEIVNEVLNRECYKIVGQSRVDEAINWGFDGPVEIWLSYGVTLKTGTAYESGKADIGINVPLSDSQNLEAEIKAIQDWIATKMIEEEKNIRGGGEDFGV